jgi:hypothetical protein
MGDIAHARFEGCVSMDALLGDGLRCASWHFSL